MRSLCSHIVQPMKTDILNLQFKFYQSFREWSLYSVYIDRSHTMIENLLALNLFIFLETSCPRCGVEACSIHLPQHNVSYVLMIFSQVFATNSDFLIPISLQPNVIELRYISNYEFCQIKQSKFKISKIYFIRLQR